MKKIDTEQLAEVVRQVADGEGAEWRLVGWDDTTELYADGPNAGRHRTITINLVAYEPRTRESLADSLTKELAEVLERYRSAGE